MADDVDEFVYVTVLVQVDAQLCGAVEDDDGEVDVEGGDTRAPHELLGEGGDGGPLGRQGEGVVQHEGDVLGGCANCNHKWTTCHVNVQAQVTISRQGHAFSTSQTSNKQ